MAFQDVTPKAPVIKTDIVIRDGENSAKYTLYGTTCQEMTEWIAQQMYDAIPFFKANNETPEFTIKARKVRGEGDNEDDDDKDEE